MSSKKVLFVFRKRNVGNYSIEKVYTSIYSTLAKQNLSSFRFNKLVLNHNYDVICFLIHFFKSLFRRNDIIHVTGGCHYMIMAFPFQKRVLTIHDFYHYKRFKGIKKIVYDTLYYTLPIYFSTRIVVVSENTKDDLLRFFPTAKTKVKVIANPLVIPKDKLQVRKRIFSESKTMQILQIGSKASKNYERLIEATKNMNCQYHFVHSQTKSINRLIEKHQIADKSKVYSSVHEDLLYELYNTADVLYFASEAEGFGLPIIEAQACGLPVVTSNIEPLTTVAKGAIFVNPKDVEEIQKGFKKLYTTDFTQQMIVEGIENSRLYDLDTISNTYLSLYDAI